MELQAGTASVPARVVRVLRGRHDGEILRRPGHPVPVGIPDEVRRQTVEKRATGVGTVRVFFEPRFASLDLAREMGEQLEAQQMPESPQLTIRTVGQRRVPANTLDGPPTG
jgi:hypothetical protein